MECYDEVLQGRFWRGSSGQVSSVCARFGKAWQVKAVKVSRVMAWRDGERRGVAVLARMVAAR